MTCSGSYTEGLTDVVMTPKDEATGENAAAKVIRIMQIAKEM
jgi:hypothetical protein